MLCSLVLYHLKLGIDFIWGNPRHVKVEICITWLSKGHSIGHEAILSRGNFLAEFHYRVKFNLWSWHYFTVLFELKSQSLGVRIFCDFQLIEVYQVLCSFKSNNHEFMFLTLAEKPMYCHGPQLFFRYCVNIQLVTFYCNRFTDFHFIF